MTESLKPSGLSIPEQMSNLPSIIAIDGPAASGKSTLGLKLAQALGYLFFDTGVMYRAVTWLVLDRGVDVSDEAAVTTLAESTPIEVAPASELDGRTSDVIVDGRDITWETRLPEVERNVSAVSAYRGVRAALSQQQRRIGLRGGVVMVGRDIGTVVLPEADLKIYLVATAEERDDAMTRSWHAAKRRITRRSSPRSSSATGSISTRDVAPLKPAEDAILLDSDNLNADQVFERVLALCQ